jgi:transcriptional regulator with XRE-family HTH domain
MEIGITLKKIRTNNNYSKQYVADCLKINVNTYINWENNKTDLNLGKCSKICELYDIDIRGLIEIHLKQLMLLN